MSVFKIQFRFLFTQHRTFLHLKIKEEFSSLHIYFTSRNTMIIKPMPYICVSQTILIPAVTLLLLRETMPTLPLAVECQHLASVTQESNYFFCI